MNRHLTLAITTLERISRFGFYAQKFSFDIGAGVKAFLTKNIYLRADLRGFCVLTEAQGSFIYANGVTVASFSGSTLWQGQMSAGVGFTF